MTDEQENALKELGLVVGTKEEALWEKVKQNTKERIEYLESELIVSKELLKIAEDKTKGIIKA